MYGIALSAAACLRAGTRADVVWLVEADGFAVEDWSEAVMFTPGGGRVGALAGGRFDSALEDMAGRWEAGRLVDVEGAVRVVPCACGSAAGVVRLR